jgi:hypothetical protein
MLKSIAPFAGGINEGMENRKWRMENAPERYQGKDKAA